MRTAALAKSNVVSISKGRPPPPRRYSLEVISQSDVNGMVLIEGCVPRVAYQKFLRILEGNTGPR